MADSDESKGGMPGIRGPEQSLGCLAVEGGEWAWFHDRRKTPPAASAQGAPTPTTVAATAVKSSPIE